MTVREVVGRMTPVGLGTARGGEDPGTGARMASTLATALRHGVRVVDTAVNYRRGRSEQLVGEAVREAVDAGALRRHEVVVMTKAGYVRPAGGVEPPGPPPEPHGPLDHCLEPACLRHQLDSSLAALGMDAVDVWLLHNPEEQRRRIGGDEFARAVRAAFEVMEQAVADGRTGAYGVATWQTRGDGPEALDIPSMKRLAAEAAGGPDHFGVVQAPLSMLRQDALAPTHLVDGSACSLPEACARLGMTFVASAAAGGGAAPSLAVASVRWVAALPGVTTAVVGTLDAAHLLAAAGEPATVVPAG